MNYQDYEDLIVILTFAKTKLNIASKAHRATADKIDNLINKLMEKQADFICERY